MLLCPVWSLGEERADHINTHFHLMVSPSSDIDEVAYGCAKSGCSDAFGHQCFSSKQDFHHLVDAAVF